MLHTRGDEHAVVLREGLRQNPTPQLTLEDCWPGITALQAASRASATD